jgi:hypothetical protein
MDLMGRSLESVCYPARFYRPAHPQALHYSRLLAGAGPFSHNPVYEDKGIIEEKSAKGACPFPFYPDKAA